MGSSSSTAAAAGAGAPTSTHPHDRAGYVAQQYYNRAQHQQEYERRFEYEYCYGGQGPQQHGDRYSNPQVQQQQPIHASGSNRDLFHQQSNPEQQRAHVPQPNKHEKKKKWWKRRSSRSSDPGQPLRELLGTWSLGEVVALVHEYECMTNEKELYIHAESARPRAPTLRSDLADLLDFKWNSDVNLVLPPAIFPAHRAILSQRSKYFRNLLNSSGNTIERATGITNVNVEDTSVDIPTFSGLLRYLYTEEVPNVDKHEGMPARDGSGTGQQHQYHALGTIIRPSKPLESDLRDLLQTGKYSDISLVLGDEQFAVHKPILAARSPFFRSLLQRRSNSKKIVLDDTVIPKRYARVILNCMYTDKLDLSLIEATRSGLTEVESLTFTGKVNPNPYEEAMELYQIGRFLEFDHLCVSSEDIITESLTHDSLPQILRWSSQSHGSAWVRRQAIMYVQEEYASLISNPSFLELDRATLLEVVQSDFLQASEVEVLNSIIKWGEHQLIKRVEDREPNLVSSTRDSVFRNERGGKERGKRGRNDKTVFASDMHLNDGELREIVFELIRCVRVDHIGLSNEFLVGAVRRGLVSIPPTHMITEEKVNPWVNNLQCPNYIRPRLYTPYYEEAKSALRNRTGGVANEYTSQYSSHSSNLAYLNSIGRIKTLRPIIPDTLYMIDNSEGSGERGGGGVPIPAAHHHHHERTYESVPHERNVCKDEKETEESAAPEKEHPVEEMVVDQELLNAMVYREKKLRSAHLRNLSNPISRERATKFIRLRVVREFGYPDYVAELLDNHNRANAYSLPTSTTTTTTASQSKEKSESTETTKRESNVSPFHDPTPPPPPEFHTNMPDVACTTTTESNNPATSSVVTSTNESLVIPFLDLDLGDNGKGDQRGNLQVPVVPVQQQQPQLHQSSTMERASASSSMRARNRSVGSLASARACSSTQSLVGSNLHGQFLQQHVVGTYNTHHPFSYTRPHYVQYAALHPPQQQAQQQPVYQSIYSTTQRSNPHHHVTSYPICSTSYSNSLHRIASSSSQQQQQQHATTLLRSSMQLKNTPPSHYL